MKSKIFIISILSALLLTGCWPDPEPDPPCDLYEVNVKTTLNLRAEPDKNGEIVGRYRRGDIVKVSDETDNGWAAIYYAGRVRGYVSMDYLTLIEKHRGVDETQDNDNANGSESAITVDPAGVLNSNEEVGDADGMTKDNVTIDDEEGIFTTAQRQYIIDSLSLRKDYTYIITATRSIDKGDILSHGSDMLSQFSDHLDAGISWWTKFKSWFGGDLPSSNLVVISYVADIRMLQANSNGVAMKYVMMKEPDKYFDIQNDAINGEIYVNIAKIGNLVADGGEDYAKRNWFVKGQINTGDILDGIIDGLLADNILPSNSRWHKWLFGWLFALPFAFANWLLNLCGSYVLTMFAFMIVYLLIQYVFARTFRNDVSDGKKALGCFLLLPKIFVWVSFLTLVVYITPDMSTVLDLKESGYSSGLIKNVTHHFMNDHFGKPWWIVVLFIISMMFVKGVDGDLAVYSRLKPIVQQRILKNAPDKVQSMMTRKGIDTELSKLESEDEPMSALFLDKLGNEIGTVIATTLPLSFVFSGTLILFATIYLLTISLARLIMILRALQPYRQQGALK